MVSSRCGDGTGGTLCEYAVGAETPSLCGDTRAGEPDLGEGSEVGEPELNHEGLSALKAGEPRL